VSDAAWMWIFKSALILSCGVSAVTSLWMLLRVGPYAKGGSLFPRQLWHLGLADFLATGLALAGALQIVVREMYPQTAVKPEVMHWLCNLWFLDNIGQFTSLYVEIHLSISSVAAILRWKKTMRILQKCLSWGWVFGVVLGLVVTLVDDVYWDNQDMVCNTHNMWGDTAKDWCLIVAFFVCLACYLCGHFKMRNAGLRARQRIWERMRFYIIVALICWSCWCVVTLQSRSQLVTSQGLFFFAMSLYNLDGFLNFLVYFIGSRLARKLVRRGHFPSAHEGTSVVPMSLSSTDVACTNDLESWPKDVFSVNFADRPHEVEEVPATQAEAIARAEEQTERYAQKRKQRRGLKFTGDLTKAQQEIFKAHFYDCFEVEPDTTLPTLEEEGLGPPLLL